MQRKRRRRAKAMEAARAFLSDIAEDTIDPLGSYSGTPKDGNEPTQDADDI